MVAVDATGAGSRELGLAAVAHLSRYRGISREHTESDLGVFFAWCQQRQLAPLHAQRNDVEPYVRCLQDVHDPRTTMRYDRARKNLDRHPNYILAAYMASGT